MKARIAPGLIALLISGASLIAQGQVNRKQPGHKLDFELSPYGTLLKLEVDGKAYGEGSLREGYAIGYRVGADERFVYAYRDQSARNLSPARPEKQQANSRVVTTNDGVWRITSRFSWNNKSGKVTILREIENVSSQPAEMLIVKSQLDNYLAGVEPETLIPSLKAPLPPLPIYAAIRLPSANCGKPPCPDGCGCSSCPICTMLVSDPRYSIPGVLLHSANEAHVEISTSSLGHSRAPDHVKESTDLTLCWRTGSQFVPTRVLPRQSVTFLVEMRLR